MEEAVTVSASGILPFICNYYSFQSGRRILHKSKSIIIYGNDVYFIMRRLAKERSKAEGTEDSGAYDAGGDFSACPLLSGNLFP